MNKPAKRPQMPGSHKLSMDGNSDKICNLSGQMSYVHFSGSWWYSRKLCSDGSKIPHFFPCGDHLLPVYGLINTDSRHILCICQHTDTSISQDLIPGENLRHWKLSKEFGGLVQGETVPTSAKAAETEVNPSYPSLPLPGFCVNVLAGLPPSLNTFTHKENKETIISGSLQNDN